MPAIWLRGATGVRTLLAPATLPVFSLMRHNAISLSAQQLHVTSKTTVFSPKATALGSVNSFFIRKWSSTSQLSQQSSSRVSSSIDGSKSPSKQEAATGQHGPPSTTPGAASIPPEGQLSIVFTDIVKSTSIWEKNPSAMVEAMNTHDLMIRDLVEANHGYEVKQNGDGFMIAFASATTAVRFCLDVQEQLLDENWPAAILKLPPGKETTDDHGNVLFRGLKLRISAHWGTPICHWNDVIQRMDYLGPLVNRAARFIEVTEGGQVVVSEDFLLQLQSELEVAKGEKEESEVGDSKRNPEDLDLSVLRSRKDQEKLTHQHFQIRLLGDHELRGLSEPQKLYFIVPSSLEGRVNHWHSVRHVTGVKGNIRTVHD